MKLIQISDTHLGEPGSKLFGLDPAAQLEQCVRHVNAQHADALLCVITGDLANTGTESEYRELKRVVSQLSIPYRLIPGNHDARGPLRAVFPELPFEPGEFLHQQVDTPEATLLLLDTHEPGTDSGKLCRARLDWLEARLAQAHRPVIVFMHHPPMSIGHQAMDRMALRDPGIFLDLLARHSGRVRHVCFGHVHRPFFTTMNGVGFSAVPGTNHQVSLIGMDRGDLFASGEPGGYAVILFEGGRFGIHIQGFADVAVFGF
jgi:3',5'-cyclic-AMP phosphodiesterase